MHEVTVTEVPAARPPWSPQRPPGRKFPTLWTELSGEVWACRRAGRSGKFHGMICPTTPTGSRSDFAPLGAALAFRIKVARTGAQMTPSEWAVLALLAEGPTHGFAIARAMGEDGEIGRVWSLRRPRVYHAIETLTRIGFARPAGTEASRSGPDRTVLEITPEGARAIAAASRPPSSTSATRVRSSCSSCSSSSAVRGPGAATGRAASTFRGDLGAFGERGGRSVRV